MGSLWVIEDGLKAGERVVFEGVAKATDGATVVPTQATIQAEGKK
jgi:hypothetical protein